MAENGTTVRETDTDHPVIKLGSRGANVKLWQGVIGTPADGVFGPNTDALTRSWQSAHGITADGIVGPLTWQTSMATPKPATPVVLQGNLVATASSLPLWAKALAGFAAFLGVQALLPKNK